jgi:hypothetical protein
VVIDDDTCSERRMAIEVAALAQQVGKAALVADRESLRRALVYLRRAALELTSPTGRR